MYKLEYTYNDSWFESQLHETYANAGLTILNRHAPFADLLGKQADRTLFRGAPWSREPDVWSTRTCGLGVIGIVIVLSLARPSTTNVMIASILDITSALLASSLIPATVVDACRLISPLSISSSRVASDDEDIWLSMTPSPLRTAVGGVECGVIVAEHGFRWAIIASTFPKIDISQSMMGYVRSCVDLKAEPYI